MNKRIIYLLVCAALIFTSCAAGQISTEQTETNDGTWESELIPCDVYKDVLSEYFGRCEALSSDFSIVIDGAPQESAIHLKYDILKSEGGYSANGEGKTVSCEGEMTDDFKKAVCYLPPYDADIQGEISAGSTVFVCEPDVSDLRDNILICSPFFEGYEDLGEEGVVISNLIYTARSENGRLCEYGYSYTLVVNDTDTHFTARVCVNISVMA